MPRHPLQAALGPLFLHGNSRETPVPYNEHAMYHVFAKIGSVVHCGNLIDYMTRMTHIYLAASFTETLSAPNVRSYESSPHRDRIETEMGASVLKALGRGITACNGNTINFTQVPIARFPPKSVDLNRLTVPIKCTRPEFHGISSK